MSDFKYYRPNNFPPVVKNLLIINVLVFIAQNMFKSNNNIDLDKLFALHDIRSAYFEPYQLITHMFMHGSVAHIFFNMFALWMFGKLLENVWGSKRFLTFYIVCGLGAAVLHLIVLYFEMSPIIEAFKTLPPQEQIELKSSPMFILNGATMGASGAIFGCLAAFGYLFPNTEIYIYFLLPMKAKWFVLLYAGMELWLGVQNSAGDNVAHFAHLGGAITGLILVLIWNKGNRKTFY